MLIRPWDASVMMDIVVLTVRKRNVPLEMTFSVEMEAPRDAIALAVVLAAM
jgi:hypothetical protein